MRPRTRSFESKRAIRSQSIGQAASQLSVPSRGPDLRFPEVSTARFRLVNSSIGAYHAQG